MPDGPRAEYRRRWDALKTERQSWDAQWKDIAENCAPRRARFFASDRKQQGSKRNDKIINGTPIRARRLASAGMMAGMSSPARPWFRLTTPDPDLNEFGPVKEWLYAVEELFREIFSRSNFYNALHQVYDDLLTFGTAAMAIEDDDEDVIRCYVFPIGSYCLAQSDRLRVDTIYRETTFTARQLQQRFGDANLSRRTLDLLKQKRLDEPVECCHVIEPNTTRNPSYADAQNMPFRSAWFEKQGDDEILLRVSGFEEFPVMAPRWSVTGEDVYGHGPGMDALGDMRALQLMERRGYQALDKIVNPPMQVPAAMKKERVSLLSGDTNYIPALAQGAKMEPAHVIDGRVLAIQERIDRVEQRVNQAFYADLWMLISESDRRQITAEEIRAKQEEKMLQLGPTVERQGDELHDPAFDRIFPICERRGMLPEPPSDLQGTTLGIEYISILAQAQKAVGVAAVDRTVMFALGCAEANPDILDRVNFDEGAKQVALMTGAPPKLIRSDAEVTKLREQRAKAQQEMAMAEQAKAAQSGAMAAKTLSETRTGGDSLLDQLAGVA